MVENSGIGEDGSRDAVLRPPVDPEETTNKAARPAPTPAALVLPPPARIVAAARPAGAAATRPPPVAAAARAPGAVEKPKGIPVGAAAKKAVTKKATAGRPPLSPTSIAATTKKVQSQHLKRSLGVHMMSTATGSDGSSNPQCGSQASQVQSDSIPISGSPQLESTNDSLPIEIDDDEDEEERIVTGSKRKLKSAVWNEFTKVEVGSSEYAKCNYCGKKLSGVSKNGTNHLKHHLKTCVLKKVKLNGQTMVQPGLRFDRTDVGTISVENYTFDQEIARKELSAMIVLHEYPLSMVDHVGFRRFVSALQPLFKMGTRNTIRSDILAQYELEKKKAIEYMAGIQSRVAITTDMWTSDNQKRGYMAITAHFIDESWNLRNILMRFIYVPAPHTAEIICEELYDSLVQWNLDEKISAITLDNCTTNDAVIPLLVRNIGRHKLLNDDWWKVAGTRFPTLRKIARDIFAIPVTTVASESAFSTSGRVLSEHRSRLTSKMIEALMCSQDWVRNKYKVDEKNKQPATFWSCLQDIQEGLQELKI